MTFDLRTGWEFTWVRGRCSESSEARLDADPLYKDQRDRDQDADDGEFDGQRHGK